jgi:DNA-binding NarL/FixJ family response regulator
MKPISILLIDDNPVFLTIAVDFLQNYSDLELAGVANSGEEALTIIKHVQPDVIVIDLNLADMSGLDLIPHLKEMLPKAGIIILTLQNVESYYRAAKDAGADAFVSKATMYNDLIPAIRTKGIWDDAN